MVVKPPAFRQPPGVARPNYGSDLLTGVTHLIVGNAAVNLVKQQPLTISSTPPVFTPTQNGLGPKFNGSNGYWYTSAGTAALLNARNPWTQAAIVRLTANTASASTSIAYHVNSTPGGGTADRGMSTRTGCFTGYIFDGAPKLAIGTTVADPMVDYVVVVSCSGGFLKVWVNGREEASTAVSNNGYASFTAPLLVLGYGNPDVAAPVVADSIVPLYIKVDGVAWKQTQVARFYRNPWEVVEGIPRRVFLSAPAGAGNTIAVPAASLTLTGFAPTIVQTANNVIAVPAGSLTLSGQTPTVTASDHKTIAVPAGSLTLTGQTPTVVVGSPSDPQTISVPAGSLTLTGFAPTIVQTANNIVSVPAGTLTLTGQTPTVTATANNVVAVPAGTLTLSPFAPVVNPVAQVASTTPVVGGGPAPRKRHFVQIDDELFEVNDQQEAVEILQQAQELHAEVVQKAVVLKTKPPAKPVVKASVSVVDTQKAMEAAQAEAERAFQQMLDDDDEDVLLLL